MLTSSRVKPVVTAIMDDDLARGIVNPASESEEEDCTYSKN